MKSDLCKRCDEIHIPNSAEETYHLGKTFGKQLTENTIVAFFGDLGAGKTTFIRGLVEGVGGIDINTVCSPTFNFLNIYQGAKTIYHFDLYRLPREKEFMSAGFDEYFNAGGICCIEWAEKVEQLLPTGTIAIKLEHLVEGSRRMQIIRGKR
jgi:tRNA threonylcarbamoyladenosine biosynthesis protein TsaE